MKSYRFWQACSAIVLAFMILVGVFLGLGGTQEVFPFYSWFLFARVPGPMIRYELLLLSLGPGAELPAPLALEEATIGQVPRPHSVAAAQLVQRLGSACSRNDRAEVARVRRILELSYLPAGSRYALVRFRVDPLEQWLTGKHEPAELVGTFTYGSD
ncbi:hypothetical protein [Candidatus Methylacidithermus pantelleriae]|uniref:Uncharacterized protein n=1 Tax=Candidatus Methylacidithermus pantelleriae TaxID=2744239 RepID=A0A8J2BL53_9BACT|nr:hypothetical protein [Candidatus Methylacidithermus pantelleriae]CAF0692028.1 conserved hypothetical protein [Candidatus Methylacidithermus pantelleriae]